MVGLCRARTGSPLLQRRGGFKVGNDPMEVEHLVPLSCGGIETAANWALACRARNLGATHVKGNDPESHAVVRLSTVLHLTVCRLRFVVFRPGFRREAGLGVGRIRETSWLRRAARVPASAIA